MVGSSGDVSMRVLAFEDSYDIEKILVEGGVNPVSYTHLTLPTIYSV